MCIDAASGLTQGKVRTRNSLACVRAPGDDAIFEWLQIRDRARNQTALWGPYLEEC